MNGTPLHPRLLTSALLLTAGATLAACGAGSGSETTLETPTASNQVEAVAIEPVVDGELVLPDGWYELAGYGTVLHAEGSTIVPYFSTGSTCTIGETLDNSLDVDHASGGGPGGGAITMDLVGPTTDYRLLQLTGSPNTCGSTADRATAVESLVALDELFTKHYPFFDQRGVDWPETLGEIDAAVGQGLTADEELAVFEQALARFMVDLGDGHTTLEQVDVDPNFEAFGVDGVDSIEELETLLNTEIEATFNRLEDIQFDPSGTVGWGHLTDGAGVGHSTGGIGYLFIGGFEGLSLSGDGLDDLTALSAALDLAIADLAGRFDAVIVDVRFNQGGYEDLAIAAAGYFVDPAAGPAEAYRKWAHAQPDPIAQTVMVEPANISFGGHVAVLASPITASAAEAFLLAMRETTDATLIGSPSFGEFSDAIDWRLPNGIEFTLSMENYTDLAGNNYEAVGVPVDLPVPFDQSLEKAITTLADRR